MRAGTKPPEGENQARYLGEIAPLLEAARPLPTLTPVEQRQVRKRIARTLFGGRSFGLRGRLVPALAALAAFVVGGAAFATAHRLGLLPGLGSPAVGSPAAPTEPRKRKAARGRPSVRPASTVAPAESESPAAEPLPVLALPPAPVPAPSSAPPSPSPSAAPAPSPAPSPAALPASKSPVGPRAPAGRPGGRLAMSDSRTVIGGPAPVIPAPPDEPAAVPSPQVAAVPAAPPFLLRSAGVTPAPAPDLPAPARAAVPAPAPVSSAPAAPATKPPAADQTLFGQALRKLRAENDAASALAALREHGKAFPGSALAGERKALEVEALLALHREREALALLDTMAIDELPRGGERLVVRGELRAAANRWLEAQTDFDRALARVSGSPAWHERALWGRGVSRLRLGEREAGLADVERYLDTYPKGRFAAEAAKFFPGR